MRVSVRVARRVNFRISVHFIGKCDNNVRVQLRVKGRGCVKIIVWVTWMVM